MGCSYKSIPYDKVETSFMAMLSTPEYFEAITDTKNDKSAERLAILRGEMATVHRQIEKYRKKFQKMDDPPESLMEDLKRFETEKVQLSKAIKLAEEAFRTAKTIPSEFTELYAKAWQMLNDKEGRMKIREYIRGVIDEITLDVTSENPNYQVQFKNGFVGSVVMWRDRQPHGAKTDFFQINPGVVRKPDYQRPVFVFSKGLTKEQLDDTTRLYAKRRSEGRKAA